MKKICFLLLVAAAFWFSPLRWKVLPPEIEIANYNIQKLEPFTLDARVLSTRYYRGDRESELSPVDLALGWGRMADPAITEQIEVSQSNRWYRWSCRNFPIPRREIETHSANMHMIPASDAALKQLLQVKTGHRIQLSGHLVSITAEDGWRWKSSLTPNDTGAGACEVVLVDSIVALAD